MEIAYERLHRFQLRATVKTFFEEIINKHSVVQDTLNTQISCFSYYININYFTHLMHLHLMNVVEVNIFRILKIFVIKTKIRISMLLCVVKSLLIPTTGDTETSSTLSIVF